VKHRIDPVLEPIGFGFAASLARYARAREILPGADMMMGTGNITELTGADSAPINVVLLGFCEELGIRSVLTTEVIHWARSSVRELDLARRLVHFAVKHRRLPKHIEPKLHLLRDETLRRHGRAELDRLASEIRDRNFRIFAEDGSIHVLSSELHLEGTDPFELFPKLGVSDASHAFYLGYEMAKAVTALTLGKNYTQDEALRWGFLTREERSHRLE
jgi:dihydropteroate synthase